MPKPMTMAVSTSACGSGSAIAVRPGAMIAGEPMVSRPIANRNRFTA